MHIAHLEILMMYTIVRNVAFHFSNVQATCLGTAYLFLNTALCWVSFNLCMAIVAHAYDSKV